MTNNYLEECCTVLRIESNNPLAPKILIIQHLLTTVSQITPKSFHSSSVYGTGLSDFHRLTLTVLKTFHVKYIPKIIQYRDFSHFDNASFRADLLQKLSLKNVLPREFEKFKYISLNIHAPIKKKHVRCNQSPLWVNNSEKRLWLGLVVLINKGKIIMPGTSLPIKEK